MDQFKFSLGPFEIFSAIMGGIPLVVADSLLYYPLSSLRELAVIVQRDASIVMAIACLLASYILSGVVQVLSWKYFKLLCRLSRKRYSYFSNIFKSSSPSMGKRRQANIAQLTFDERLAFLLRTKLDIRDSLRWMDARLKAYLREHDKQSVLDEAELHLATHIMYRNWSLGFFILSFILAANLFRISLPTVELFLLPLASLAFSYATFRQSLNFKRWHNRALVLGFYFVAAKDA